MITEREFTRMLEYVSKNKEISTIVVYSLDRFSRTGGQATKIIDDLRISGVEVRSVQQDFDTKGYSGKMMQEIMMIIAKGDNEMRREKSTTGMIEKLKQGYWINKVPKGYTNKNKHEPADRQQLEINKEGKLIKRAYGMRIKGCSYQSIYNKLSPLGFTTKPRNIPKMLANPFYAGFLTHSLLKGQLVTGNHPKLINESDFLLANAVKPKCGGKWQRSNKAHSDLPLKTFMERR